jgi:hypothetical protein
MNETADGWNSCPSGELVRLGALLAFRRRVRAAATAGVILLATAGVAGAGWLAYAAVSPSQADPACGPCSDEPHSCGVETTPP